MVATGSETESRDEVSAGITRRAAFVLVGCSIGVGLAIGDKAVGLAVNRFWGGERRAEESPASTTKPDVPETNPAPSDRGLAWALRIARASDQDLWDAAADFCWVAADHPKELRLFHGLDRLAEICTKAPDAKGADQILVTVISLFKLHQQDHRFADLKLRVSPKLRRSVELLERETQRINVK